MTDMLIANTVLAGAAGMVGTLGWGWLIRGRADVDLVLNGAPGRFGGYYGQCARRQRCLTQPSLSG